MSKVVVITGATRGLGSALVQKLVQVRGKETVVAGCGRNPSHILELQHRFPTPHLFSAVDVTDGNSVAKWAVDVLSKLGPPDLLINNAAIMNPLGPLWTIDAGSFDRLIDVNIKGVANSIRAFVPAMVARKSGVIVNLSSGWGRSTSPNVAPYCGSKYAIEGLTLAMAQELPKGMAAIPLNPGVINTDMLRGAWGDDASQYPSADEWAERAVPFLLSLGPRDNGKSLTVR